MPLGIYLTSPVRPVSTLCEECLLRSLALFVVAAVTTVVGVALIYVPAALIVTGVAVAVFALYSDDAA